MISLEEIAALVQLPGREELLAKVLYLLCSPARGVASAMQSVMSGMARALNQAVEQNKFAQ